MSNTYHWIGNPSTVGTFGAAAKWYDDTTGIAGSSAPGPADTAHLIGAGGITGTGTVSTLNVEDTTGNGFTIGAASLTANTISVAGSLSLNYETALTASAIDVGSSSAAGFMQVVGGASLQPLGGSLDLTVSSATQNGSFATLYLGANYLAASQIELGAGTALVGTGSGQSGSLFVGDNLLGGAGSVLNIGQDGGTGSVYVAATVSTAGSIVIGDGGVGVLNSEGGQIDAGSGSGTALIMGVANSDSSQIEGLADVTGTEVTLTGLADIGDSGFADFSALAGSLTTMGGAVLGALGNGTLSLGTGETWSDTGNVVVGQTGTGSRMLAGDLANLPAATIGDDLLLGDAGGAGNVTIDGEALEVAGSTTLGLANGSAAVNSITVEQGGTLNSAGESIDLLPNLATDGENILAVTGSGSALKAGELIVGYQDAAGFFSSATATIGTSTSSQAMASDGDLTITTGASVSATGQVELSGLHALLLQGTLSIDAAAPALTITGDASIGDNAALTADGGIVLDGATGSFLEFDSGVINANGGKNAAIDVTGGAELIQNGGTLNTTGEFVIGDAFPGSAAGAGTLATYSGSSITSTAARGGAAVIIGGDTAPGNFADVNGTAWKVTGDMDVGTIGSGTLSPDGSVINISGTLDIGSDGGTGNVHDVLAVQITGNGTLPSGLDGIAARSLAIAGADSVLITDTLTVGNGRAAAGVSMAGGTISASGSIVVADRSLLHGSGTLESAAIVDMGHIQVVGGTMSCLGSITGDGLLRVQGGGDMILGQGEAAGVGLVFGSFGTYTAATIASIAGTLSGWQHGDAIDFTGEAIASDHFADHTLSLYDANGNLLGTEQFAGALTSNSFSLSADKGSGTILSYHR